MTGRRFKGSFVGTVPTQDDGAHRYKRQQEPLGGCEAEVAGVYDAEEIKEESGDAVDDEEGAEIKSGCAFFTIHHNKREADGKS